MTFLTAVGSFTSPTSSPYTSTVSLSFTPVAVIFWANVSNATSGWVANAELSIGFAANNTAKSSMQYGTINTWGLNGRTSANSTNENAQSSLNSLMVMNGCVISTCSFSNGFVATYSTHTTAYTINYLAIGGTEVTNAGVLPWYGPATTGAYSVTGLGFKPDMVINLYQDFGNAPDSSWGTSVFGIGAMDKDGHQWAAYVGALGGMTTTFAERLQVTDSCLAVDYPGYLIQETAAFTSMDSDGFTVNYGTNSDGGCGMLSLCIKGGLYQVGNFAKSVSAAPTTNQITTTGITPSAVMSFTDSLTAVAGLQGGFRYMIGASDGTNHRISGANEQDQVALGATTPTSVEYTYESTTTSLAVANNDAQTAEATGTLDTFTSGSFTASWATNNAVSTQICYIAMGASGITSPSWTQSTIPTCSTASSHPVVTVAGAVEEWSQATIPTCTTATVAPNIAAGAVEANCVVKYSTWPEGAGTTVVNQAASGPTYDGTITGGTQITLPSGHTAVSLATTTGYIQCPTGTLVSNQAQDTIELIFRIDVDPLVDIIIWAKGFGFNFVLATQWGGLVEISRYDNNATTLRRYRWYGCNWVVGAWYDLQLTWDMSTGATPTEYTSVPTLTINNVLIDATRNGGNANPVDESTTVTNWIDDSGYNVALWNYDASVGGTVDSAGTIALYRHHNVSLSPAQLSNNYFIDQTIYMDSWAETTVPTCVTAALVPTVSVVYGWSESTLPNCFTAASVPTVYTSVQNWSFTVTTIPSCFTTASIPGVSSGVTWIESVIPTAITAAAVSVGDSITEALTTVSGGLTNALVPSVLTGVQASWSEGTPPFAYAQARVPIVSITKAWTESTIPTCLTASSVPTITLTNSWTQTVIPNCVPTATIIPSVATIETLVISLSVIPTCLAAASVPTVATTFEGAWTEAIIPACVTATHAPYVWYFMGGIEQPLQRVDNAAIPADMRVERAVLPTNMIRIPVILRWEVD